MTGTETVDIAVVGAGVVGLCVCALLEKLGYRIALIDRDPRPPPLPEPYDLRTYALTPASMRVFDKLGVSAALQASRIAEIRAMRVWDAGSDGALEFSAAALGRRRLGTIVEQSNLLCALHTVLAARSEVVRFTGRLSGLDQCADIVHLRLDSGEQLSAPLVLACDGADSTMRGLLGLNPNAVEFAQHAIVCNVEVERDHDNVARQRFLAAGPLAFLPLPAARMCAIVWSTTPQQAARAAGASNDAFAAMLGSAFDHALGRVRATSERLVVTLRTLHAGHYAVARTVLLGDAAHVVHPLAGQGLNLGLMDAAALAEALGPREALGLRFPRTALRRFERARRGENLAWLKLTEHLNRLFRDEHRSIQRLRGAGLSAVDRILPLKHWLMLRAMGELGDVPAIASKR